LFSHVYQTRVRAIVKSLSNSYHGLLLYSHVHSDLEDAYFVSSNESLEFQSLQPAITKYHKLVAYKQQKFISHSSGGWKVKHQDIDRFGVWRESTF
jgi:hypothetical protein